MAQQVTLQVSDRTFITTKHTLVNGTGCGSEFFAKLFASQKDHNDQTQIANLSLGDTKSSSSSQPSPMPTYFLDMDPRIFNFILDYLRTGIMPFVWTDEKGFDYMTYVKLERMAKALQIPKLAIWLQNKQYLHAVQQSYTAETLSIGKRLGQEPSVQFAGGPEKMMVTVLRHGEWGANIVVMRKRTTISNQILYDGL